MWIKGELTLYGLKNNRKNSKSCYKSKQIVEDRDGKHKMKEFYTITDLWDFMSFMVHSPYKNFKVVAYSNFSGKHQYCLSTFNNYQAKGDIESVINLLYETMRILNFKEWDFTLQDFHTNPNTRYLINQFYHPTK